MIMRSNRGVQQTAITARVNEASKQIGIVPMRGCALQQTFHRLKRPSEICFEKSIEIVRESQVWVESEGLLKCIVGGGEIVGSVHTILRQVSEDSP